jgi:hypothetical protein
MEDYNIDLRQLRNGLSDYQLLKGAFGPRKQLEKFESEDGIQQAQKDTLVGFYHLDTETSFTVKNERNSLTN